MYETRTICLTNALATFQNFINDALQPFLDRFATAYLDDILIYSDTLGEHKENVRQALEQLQRPGLHLKPEKCEFKTEVKYLGLIIGREGIKMDPEKVRAIRDWEVPGKLFDVRSFLGFANFYRRFIYVYSDIVRPLTELTRKGKKWSWDPEHQTAFERRIHQRPDTPTIGLRQGRYSGDRCIGLCLSRSPVSVRRWRPPTPCGILL